MGAWFRPTRTCPYGHAPLDTIMAEEGEGGGSISASAKEGASGGSGAGKVVLVKHVALPWDPLNSTDWDGESHTKEALLRIKR